MEFYYHRFSIKGFIFEAKLKSNIYEIHNTYEPYELLLIVKMRIKHSTLAS